jgi:uncharacterized protein
MLDLVALLSAFLVGFVGSGHCLAMCGALSQGFARSCGGGCSGNLRRNLVRIAGYGLLGALAGGLGNTGLAVTRALAYRDVLQSLSGVLMLVTGAVILLGSNRMAWLARPGLRLLPLLVRIRMHLPKSQGWMRDLSAGLLWSLMPCGMVYAIIVSAWLSTSALQGGLLLLSFGLGTLPSLLSLELLLAQLQRRPKYRRVLAAGLLLLGASAVAIAQDWLHLPMPSWLPEGCIPVGRYALLINPSMSIFL